MFEQTIVDEIPDWDGSLCREGVRQEALDETGLSTGTIVTYEDEEEMAMAAKTIHVVPAYKYFYEGLQEPLLTGASC
jgi:hypothetical protein